MDSLQIKHNKVGVNGISDVEELKKLDNVSALDISSN